MQLPSLNEFRAMLEAMEKYGVIEMQMSKHHGVYFADSEPESTKVIVQGCNVFDWGERPDCVVLGVAAGVHENTVILTLEKKRTIIDVADLTAVPKVGIHGCGAIRLGHL